MKRQARPYQKDVDLLKVYRQAFESAKYFSDTDDKLWGYSKVIDYCAKSKKCSDTQSKKRDQILFWTYNNIGDLFLQKNLDSFDFDNLNHALFAYQNALELSKDRENQTDVLKKMRDIYLVLEDKEGYFQTSSQMARLVDETLKAEMFMSLAEEANTKEAEAYFLEQALLFVDKENISFLQKCRHTLTLCDRLLKIYQKIGKRAEAIRIKQMKEQTQTLLH